MKIRVSTTDYINNILRNKKTTADWQITEKGDLLVNGRHVCELSALSNTIETLKDIRLIICDATDIAF